MKDLQFETTPSFIEERISQVNPVAYGKTRNFIDGDVTYLSPYLSRGVLSTKQVFQIVLDRGFQPNSIEKFIQELAWRDYWQQVWKHKKDAINHDLKRPQTEVEHYEYPIAILEARTGINAIDDAIEQFYKTGYLHNHVRMYIASICTNIAHSHWSQPAKWMYYHLLDGDWASNALSWQWVAGSNSGKKYYANQDNINKYCYSDQKDSYLDCSYEDLPNLGIPAVLETTTPFNLTTPLPDKKEIAIDPDLPTFLYNYYNLDPNWHKEKKGNRVLLLEPSHFEKYPIGKKAVDFMLGLAQNINDIQVYVGEYSSLQKEVGAGTIYFKEHPTVSHYQGNQEARDWMFTVEGYFPSFFAFWKRCKKEIMW